MCELIDTNISFEEHEADSKEHSDFFYYLVFIVIIIMSIAAVYGGKKSGIFD